MAGSSTADATGRIIPSLFLLGNPKSGSTFLFSCLRAGPFDPNLVRGPYSANRWREGAYVLTTLGTKKEFNFFGGVGWRWGWDWYVGPPAPLSSWEWQPVAQQRLSVSVDGEQRRMRRGENGNGEPSEFVQRMCQINASAAAAASASATKTGRRNARAAAALACRRFPLECLAGTPIVRPGCALVRPLPSTRGCGNVASGQPPCVTPRVRMSHAWPLASEASPQALAVDPSINAFMSMPLASEQMRTHHPQASTLKFIVLLREPLARSMSSARMMLEWKWEKAGNVTSALLADLEKLGQCCEQIAPSSHAGLALDGTSGMESASSPWQRAASALAKGSDRQLGRFRACLAHKAPLNHVRGSVYAAGVLGWLSAGFSPSQFLWLETERMRATNAQQLLTSLASFAGLPTDHLKTLPADIRTACEAGHRASAAPRGRRLSSSSAGGGGRRLSARPAGDSRRQTHAMRALPPEVAQPLRAAFKPWNELLKTLLNDVAPTLRGVQWLS